MYIKYTSFDFCQPSYLPSILSCSASVIVPLITEALSLGFGFNLGFLHWSGSWFTIHEVSLLALALLETSGLVNHQHLMLLLDFYLRSLSHREELGNCLFHPLHIIVHHEAFIAWWQ